MKKTTLLCAALLMLSINSLFAQKCKYDLDKTDAFTGMKEQRIEMRNGFERAYFFAFYHKNENYGIESVVKIDGVQNFILPKGSKLDIKLTNGKIFTLESIMDISPIANTANSYVWTTYTILCTITKEQLKEIADNGIQFSKTHLQGDSSNDHEMKPKDIEKTKTAAACMLNH